SNDNNEKGDVTIILIVRFFIRIILMMMRFVIRYINYRFIDNSFIFLVCVQLLGSID
ncbi:hypothetical protein DERP_006380, partial [Dermatophagoides pteronyssinus]